MYIKRANESGAFDGAQGPGQGREAAAWKRRLCSKRVLKSVCRDSSFQSPYSERWAGNARKRAYWLGRIGAVVNGTMAPGMSQQERRGAKSPSGPNTVAVANY